MQTGCKACLHYFVSDSKNVLQLYEDFGILIVDDELAAIGMEEVVAQGGMELVVQGVIGAEAIEDAAIGNIDVGEALQREGVVKQIFRYTERGKA